ncbi:MAG: META domain-containing protein [Hyphomonadaceae bacterium]
MKARSMILAAVVMAACTQQSSAPADLAGRWDVQQIAGASLGEGVDIWIEIDPEAGTIAGFTGCRDFTASLSSFGESLAVGALTQAPGECPSEAAATDEARFVTVLPQTQRRIVRGASLELLQAAPGSEALLRLRRAEPAGG